MTSNVQTSCCVLLRTTFSIYHNPEAYERYNLKMFQREKDIEVGERWKKQEHMNN